MLPSPKRFSVQNVKMSLEPVCLAGRHRNIHLVRFITAYNMKWFYKETILAFANFLVVLLKMQLFFSCWKT